MGQQVGRAEQQGCVAGCRWVEDGPRLKEEEEEEERRNEDRTASVEGGGVRSVL